MFSPVAPFQQPTCNSAAADAATNPRSRRSRQLREKRRARYRQGIQHEYPWSSAPTGTDRWGWPVRGVVGPSFIDGSLGAALHALAERAAECDKNTTLFSGMRELL